LLDHVLSHSYTNHVWLSSLGGALSTLLAFKLASDTKLSAVLPGPVMNISFASPLVGNTVFDEAFQVRTPSLASMLFVYCTYLSLTLGVNYQLLEQHKKIIHIRVSNSKDLIPCSLPLPGYTHTGLNLHFCEKAENGYVLASGDHHRMWTQLSFDPGSRHGLADYHQVKNACTDKFGHKTIEEIYYDPHINKRISTWTHPVSRHCVADHHLLKSACKDKIGNRMIEEIYKRMGKVAIPFAFVAGACFQACYYLLIEWIAGSGGL
jgi:hypothetical protein